MVDINEFTREVTCEYKGELYSVRDNGAVMRHIREGKKPRKLDNVWTFGTKDLSNGYMMINSHRVHIIVAKAFIPGNEDGKMVVDHIDTNRCNNRVENLRWLTRLENVLLNEATLKKVTFLCGGDINKFIENPACLQDLTGNNQDIMWMRTVTPEEAKLAWEHISAWAKRPNSTFKMMQQREGAKDFDEWLRFHKVKDNLTIKTDLYDEASSNHEKNVESFSHSENQNELISRQIQQNDVNKDYIYLEDEWKRRESFAQEKKVSLTKGAIQYHFPEKMQFPLCPENTSGGLDAYALNLGMNKVFAISENGDEYVIISLGWAEDWHSLLIGIKINGQTSFSYIHITYENGMFVHDMGNYEFYYSFCDSPNILQCGAKTQCHFPLCPKEGNITLEEYADILQKDALFETNQYTDGYVVDREITKSCAGRPILFVGVRMPDSLKQFGSMTISVENGKVIHCIGQTYFDEKTLTRAFCKLRGQEWNDDTGTIDDFC